jgi:hypothetical protein
MIDNNVENFFIQDKLFLAIRVCPGWRTVRRDAGLFH